MPEEQRPTNQSKTSPSPNRLRCRAEVDLIVKKHGNLEAIRAHLGLSRRKMCQLLLVDPSAWTRWSGGKTEAPPHIYRALEWYLTLCEKEPRALLSIGSWSTTAFEDRFQALESRLEAAIKPNLPLAPASASALDFIESEFTAEGKGPPLTDTRAEKTFSRDPFFRAILFLVVFVLGLLTARAMRI